MHQLAFKLLQFGLDAKIFYSKDVENPVHDLFKSYNIPYVFNISDSFENLLIVPETLTYYLFKYKSIKRSIWWLSVDNYFKKTLRNIIANNLGIISNYNFNSDLQIYHFCQSDYAFKFVTGKLNSCNNVFMLSDFLLDDFANLNTLSNKRKNVILYNPKKGYDFIKILKKCPNNNFEWKPLVDMSPSQVKEELLSSKVYIDFGKHPGKERFPREAAICGCCIIVGKNGSANSNKDVPITDMYKFELSLENCNVIINLIDDIFLNFEYHKTHFEDYRVNISEQENIFKKEINFIFNEN